MKKIKFILVFFVISQFLFSNEIKVGVVLVEFSNLPRNYDVSYIESMMFSTGDLWNNENIGNDIHPEGNPVFGSFREYWEQQSHGHLTFSDSSGIIYPQGSNDPWHQLNNSIEFYDNYYLGHPEGNALSIIVDELKLEEDPYYTDSWFDYIIIIYAGNTQYNDDKSGKRRRIHGLWPHASGTPGRYYILGEKHDGVFTHIGGHCHEFGHCIGLQHLADGKHEDPFEVDHFALMEVGGMNGPTGNGACPAGVNPYHKIKKGWVTPIYISDIKKDFKIEYNYKNPNYYVINPRGDLKGNLFILENRLRDGFDKYTGNAPMMADVSYDSSDCNANDGGLLIWRVSQGNNGSRPSWIHLVCADNEISDNSNKILEHLSYSRDPFPVLSSGQNVNRLTIPGTNFKKLSTSQEALTSGYAFQNILWQPSDSSVTLDIYPETSEGEIHKNTYFKKTTYVVNSMTIKQNVVLTLYADLIIEEYATLTVEQNSVINFVPGTKLIIKGKILANGSTENPVVFSPAMGENQWDGIEFINADNTSKLENCIINQAITGIRLIDSSPKIKGCLIQNSEYFGISINGSSDPIMQDNSFKNCGKKNIVR